MSESRVSVAFLTGRSDPGSNALSPAQRGFMERSPVPAGQWLDRNFPYAECGAWRETPLLRASVNNSLEYLLSRRERFRQRYRTSFMETFAGDAPVILLTGSCGLELLVNLRLPCEFLERLHVFAYGPVSRSTPDCATLQLVQGNQDMISRWWHSWVDHRIACGHMDYLDSPEMMALFSEFYLGVVEGGGNE